MEDFKRQVIELATTYGGKILLALIVLIVGLFVIKALKRVAGKAIERTKLDETVKVLAKKVVQALLYVILIISVIEILGVSMSSVIAVLASCGLAVGLAMQGALANLAGGLMILIFKPFKVGDYIVASGAEGVVKEITVFYTHILTLDNKRIIVPNGGLMNANVTNYSYENTRRVDLVFKAAFGTDQNLVLGLMLKAAEGTKGVLADPAPFARFSGCADNAQEFTLRAWCNTADYWDVYFDLLQNVSGAFGQAGIAAPATKLDVTMEK